jgi:hypothetical protein
MPGVWRRGPRQQADDVAGLAYCDASAGVCNRICKRRWIVCMEHAAHLLRPQHGIDDELDAIEAIEFPGSGGDGVVLEYDGSTTQACAQHRRVE